MLQHPFADAADQPGALRVGDELPGGYDAELRVVPAQQHFQPDDAARFQIDLRLVDQAQFLALDGLAQRGVQQHLLEGFFGHVLAVEAESVAALLFGAVHRRIRVAHQHIRGLSVLRVHADTQAGAHRNFVPIEGDRQAQGADDFFRDGRDILGDGHVFQHHQELIAADASDRVILTQDIAQALRRGGQQAVSRFVAEAVIDVLERIDIEKNHRQTLLATPRAAQALGQALVDKMAVRQPRELIVVRQLLQLPLGILELTDVGKDADVAPLFGIAKAGNGQQFGKDVAVFAPIPDFAAPETVLFQGCPHALVKALTVSLGVQQAGIRADGLAARVAGDLGEGGVDIADYALEIGDDDAFTAVVEHRGGLGKAVLGRALIGDVSGHGVDILALFGEHRGPDQQAVVAIAASVAILEIERGGPLRKLFHLGPGGRDIVLVDQAEQVATHEFIDRVAQGWLPAAVGALDRAVESGDETQAIGLFEEQAVALLGLALCADVDHHARRVAQ